MNFMHTKISFISLTRRSVIVTHFLRKYAVSLDASIWREQKEVMTRAEERKWKRAQWHYLRFRCVWEVGAGRRLCIVIDAPCINTRIYSCRDGVRVCVCWKKNPDNYWWQLGSLENNNERWMSLKHQKVESNKAFKTLKSHSSKLWVSTTKKRGKKHLLLAADETFGKCCDEIACHRSNWDNYCKVYT